MHSLPPRRRHEAIVVLPIQRIPEGDDVTRRAGADNVINARLKLIALAKQRSTIWP